MPTSFTVVVGDIGGTNARLQVFRYSRPQVTAIPSIEQLTRQTYRTNTFSGLTALLQRLFDDLRNELQSTCVQDAIKEKSLRLVLAVCGPIWNNGRSNDLNNVRVEPDGARWPHQHAENIERDLGLECGSLTFLNDFEAIGYCLAAQVDHQANELCKSSNMTVLHRAPAEGNCVDKAPVACLGAGTGLGACYLTPNGSGRYDIHPSEAGMIETFCPRSTEEWDLLQYLRRDQSFIEIEQLVSGPAFVTLLHFFSEHAKQPIASALARDLEQVSEDDAPAIIVRHAQEHHDTLCLRIVDTFLDIFGRVLGTAAQTFLPYRGLFITGGILPKLAWRWENGAQNRLLQSYLDQGPKMSDIVARVPLTLINDDDLGLKGCLYYMTIHTDQADV